MMVIVYRQHYASVSMYYCDFDTIGIDHMPTIKVSARLVRDAGVYFTGETVDYVVTVHNIDDSIGTLALCIGQLHCQQLLNANRMLVKTSNIEQSSNIDYIYASRPTVICANLQLQPNESRTFACTLQLPSTIGNIPPSYRGYALKYLYRLNIDIQIEPNSIVRSFHIGLRVLRVAPLPSAVVATDDDDEPHSVVELALEAIETLTSIRNSHVYSITNGIGRVATLMLTKKSFKLGEDVIGRFAFDQRCLVPCLQYCVSLQSVEQLDDQYRKPDHQQSSLHITTHATEHAVSLFLTQSLIKLHIPLSATPTFINDIGLFQLKYANLSVFTVHLNWRLHFEFVTCKSPLDDAIDGVWNAPDQLEIETMVMDLPITVLPCSPLNACLSTVHIEHSASLLCN